MSAKSLARELVKYGELAQVDGLADLLNKNQQKLFTLQVCSWLSTVLQLAGCWYLIMEMSLGHVRQRRLQAWQEVPRGRVQE